MADFIELKESYLPSDGDWYKVSGTITEEDIQRINSLPRKTFLVIENTKGLSSDIIGKITSNNISFSVIGGLDYFNKEKYKNKDYVLRTIMSPFGLVEVIKYFEEIEKQMSPEWTDTQKCMFLYNALTRDFTYEENYKTQITKGTAERSLNGILYKKLVCSGFALVFKEGLDRLGIKNVYQNQKGHHSWNIVESDGKLRGLELTWDCYNKGSDNVCQFRYFGQEKDFYGNKAHSLSREEEEFVWNIEEKPKTTTVYEEETQFDLTPFTVEELKDNYSVIAPAINARLTQSNPLFNNPEEERKMLPIDRTRYFYQKQCESEQYYMLLYQFLKSSNQLECAYDYIKIRQSFTGDVLGTLPEGLVSNNTSSFTGSNIGIESLSNCEFNTNGDYNTPFGIKVSIRNMENTTDKKAMEMMFAQLKRRLHEYSVKYLVDLLNDSENILSSYQQFRSMTVKKDLNLSIVETDLYTKLQSLLVSKNLLLASGIQKEVIDEKIGKIESYFESLKRSSIITEEEQKERDIDFLYGVFSDRNEIRQICEKYDGHIFTEEEWQQKSTTAQYMLQVFDKLDIKPEYVQIVLNELFGSSYSDATYDEKKDDLKL